MVYLKLKEIQGFTVVKYNKFFWQMWDEGSSKYVKAEEWSQGMSKMHQLEVNSGDLLEISNAQLGQMLTGLVNNGVADINNREFSVKTNGKEGKDIRYFINPVFNSKPDSIPLQNTSSSPVPGVEPLPNVGEPISAENIPF